MYRDVLKRVYVYVGILSTFCDS